MQLSMHTSLLDLSFVHFPLFVFFFFSLLFLLVLLVLLVLLGLLLLSRFHFLTFTLNDDHLCCSLFIDFHDALITSTIYEYNDGDRMTYLKKREYFSSFLKKKEKNYYQHGIGKKYEKGLIVSANNPSLPSGSW